MRDDMRVKPGRGNLQTQLMNTNATLDGVTPIAAGDPAIIALILATTWAAMVFGDTLSIGLPRTSGGVIPLVTLSPDSPSAVLRLEDYGDLIWTPLVGIKVGTGTPALAVWGVRWWPEGR